MLLVAKILIARHKACSAVCAPSVFNVANAQTRKAPPRPGKTAQPWKRQMHPRDLAWVLGTSQAGPWAVLLQGDCCGQDDGTLVCHGQSQQHIMTVQDTMHMGACSVAVSYKPPMLVTRV